MATLSLPTRRARWLKTAAYYAAFVALGTSGAAIGPTLSALARQIGVGLGEISIIFTMSSLGYFAGSQVGGRLYDRWPGHPVMAMSLLLMAAMVASIPLTSSLWMLSAVVLLLGFAQGTIDVGGNALIVWVHRHEVGPFMNGLHFFFGVGSTFAPFLVGQLLLWTNGVHWAYWMLSLLMVPITAFVWSQPSPPDITDSEEEGPARVDDRLVFLIALFLFLYVGAEFGAGSWIATYVPALDLGDEVLGAYVNAAFWGAFTLGRLLSIPIAVFAKPRTILGGDLLGCFISLAVILAWPGASTALWIGTIGLGLCMASVFPTMFSLAERYLTLTGDVTSRIFVGVSGGAMVLPWLIGQLFEPMGARITMVAILTSLILAFLLYLVILAYTRSVGPEKSL
jgi:MFS transporter, FHS family, Na+ dependent glucose transporter 1